MSRGQNLRGQGTEKCRENSPPTLSSHHVTQQLEEMLKEVRVEYDNESDLDDALRQLRECIDSIRPMETQVGVESRASRTK